MEVRIWPYYPIEVLPANIKISKITLQGLCNFAKNINQKLELKMDKNSDDTSGVKGITALTMNANSNK